MKKHLLLLSALAVSTLSFSQSAVSFGVRGGVAYAGLRGDAVSSLQNILDVTGGAITTNSRTGVYGGVYASVPLSAQFSIEPGLGYTQRGYGLTGALNLKGTEFLGANARATLTTHYIDLPVVAKVRLSGFELFAGPQVSYLASAGLRTTAGLLGFNLLNTNTNVISRYNRVDVALTGGAGYRFGNGFSVSAAYDQGLSRLNSGQSLSAYNRTVKLGVGFQF